MSTHLEIKSIYDHVYFVPTPFADMWTCVAHDDGSLLGTVRAGNYPRATFEPEEDLEPFALTVDRVREIAEFMVQMEGKP